MEGFGSIRAFVMDVDGVMTDGGLLSYDNHEMVRVFNAKDSLAIRVALYRGYHIGVITGGETEGVRQRFVTCGVPDADIHMGCRGKIIDFEAFCEAHSLKPSEVLYVGDDVPDVPVLKAAGIGAVPSDASADALQAADYVCALPGGKGCVREVIEKAMREQGTWHFGEEDYRFVF